MNKVGSNETVDNLTGGQIQDALDHLIYEALAPIIYSSPSIFDAQAIYLLSLCTVNKKRKISSMDRELFISSMCEYLISSDIEHKLKILRNAKIERGFLCNFVASFLRELHPYVDLYHAYINTPINRKTPSYKRLVLDLRLKAYERAFKTERQYLYSTIQNSKSWLDNAYAFRNSIVNNYRCLAIKQAKAFCAIKDANYDFDDVHQNFMSMITKALDKYDSSKGALTSYINYWIFNAMTNSNKDFGYEYGIAYSIPQMRRKDIARGKASEINFSVSLDSAISDENSNTLQEYFAADAQIEKTALEKERTLHLQYLVKKADIQGLARLVLDLDEYFSSKELRLMRKTMIEQNT
jgi:hypothetical protein